MRWDAGGSSRPAAASRSSMVTPSQTVPSLLHLVTQWMSTVSSVRGSVSNSSQVHLPTSDPPSCKVRVQLSSGVCGVGPALRTGKSSVTYWPGGTLCWSALARPRPVKPLVVVMGGFLGVAPACATTRSGDGADSRALSRLADQRIGHRLGIEWPSNSTGLRSFQAKSRSIDYLTRALT